MISKFKLFAALLTGFLACTLAGAQARNGFSPAGRTPEHAGTPAKAPAPSTGAAVTAIPANRPARVIQVPANARMVSGFASDGDSFNFDTSGSPGLGFDFPHLAAIGGASQRGSFHGGRRNRLDQGAFVPVFFGGFPYYPYPYYSDGTVYDQAEQPAQQYVPQSAAQPQIIVIQQPLPVQQGASVPSSGIPAAGRDSSIPESQAPAPVREVGDFILVRRDGRVLFASVFSVVGNQVLYVTPEGIRHTLAVSDVDSDATREMNEARGTTVQIHN
jgi:hypothetical protein